MKFLQQTARSCSLVGMVHLLPLPGSPRWGGNMSDVLEAARSDAEALLEGGCDAIIVENMGDVPYLRGGVGPETVAAMTLATAQVTAFGAPTGVQVLAAANKEALGIAVATGASFLRVEAFAYAHVADEGWLEACAGALVRQRAALGAQDIQLWADVQKKHAAHAVTGDLSLCDLAKGNAFCGADALIVTGSSTGVATSPADIQDAKSAGLPVAVGSGVTDKNIEEIAHIADALIVGSWIKYEGNWRNRVDAKRVKRLRELLS